MSQLTATSKGVEPCALPSHALLAKYTLSGAYTDCYTAEVAGAVSHAQYVEAFYSGGLFKVERLLLAWFVRKPSTDAQVKELASGQLAHFAAWRVEDRSANQLLLCDFSGRTRSWLMVDDGRGGGSGASQTTRLYFGSAVVPLQSRSTGQSSMGFAFKALLGFHKLYSRALLHAAHSKLVRSVNPITP